MIEVKRGRKPLKNRDELKVQLPIYLKISTINALGGRHKAKEIVIELAEKKAAGEGYTVFEIEENESR